MAKDRNAIVVELSPENLSFWRSLTYGNGRRLVNLLFDGCRQLVAEGKADSADTICSMLVVKSIKLTDDR